MRNDMTNFSISQDNTILMFSTVYKYFLACVCLVACEILYRVYLVFYEYFINWKHYMPDQRFRQAVIYVLAKWNSHMYYALAGATLCLIVIQNYDKTVWSVLLEKVTEWSLPYFVVRVLHMTDNNVELARWIRNGSGVDYATGMASNYFHGYLHLQLPTTGHETKGIQERIKDYEDDQHVYIPIKKLFVLIPQSMYTNPKIESKIMQAAKHLETVQLDRAGVKRPFKNAVYRISKCGKEHNRTWYVVLEGATPMMSFYESLTYRWTATSAMLDMRREITLQFYRALKKIIANCPDTKDLIELIYYNDVRADGKDVDVGEIVRQRIQTLIEKDGIGMT